MCMKHHVFPIFFVVLCICASSARSQSPDLKQLKVKLDQLEQTMQDLKQQIEAAEAVQQSPGQPAAPTTSQPSQAAQLPTPQLPVEHMGALTQKREVANLNADSAPRINNEAIDPALRGYFRLPGTGTLIKLGGFVKTDVFVDTNQAGSYYGGYVPSSFPSSPQPHTVNATVSMRPSRFSAEFRQPVGNGNDSSNSVKAYLEFDFLGNYERTSLRLRQFYAQYKNLLVGQTWSAFGDPDAFPDTLEFEGPPGIMGLSQPMIRYTQPLNMAHSLEVSVEKSGTDTPFSTQYGSPVGSSTRPDLVGFYRYENAHG